MLQPIGCCTGINWGNMTILQIGCNRNTYTVLSCILNFRHLQTWFRSYYLISKQQNQDTWVHNQFWKNLADKINLRMQAWMICSIADQQEIAFFLFSKAKTIIWGRKKLLEKHIFFFSFPNGLWRKLCRKKRPLSCYAD